MRPPQHLHPTGSHTIHTATTSVAAGFPSPADDYPEPGIDLTEQLIDHPASTFLVRVAGDSMTGRGIDDGDELIVDRSLTPQDGDVIIAIIDGEFTVKTFHTGPPAMVVPANPAFDPIVLTGRDDAWRWGVFTTCLHHLRSR